MPSSAMDINDILPTDHSLDALPVTIIGEYVRKKQIFILFYGRSACQMASSLIEQSRLVLPIAAVRDR